MDTNNEITGSSENTYVNISGSLIISTEDTYVNIDDTIYNLEIKNGVVISYSSIDIQEE
jgi:hypothetical protein